MYQDRVRVEVNVMAPEAQKDVVDVRPSTTV